MCALTVSVTEANSRITEYTRPLLLIVTFKSDNEKDYLIRTTSLQCYDGKSTSKKRQRALPPIHS